MLAWTHKSKERREQSSCQSSIRWHESQVDLGVQVVDDLDDGKDGREVVPLATHAFLHELQVHLGLLGHQRATGVQAVVSGCETVPSVKYFDQR